MRKTYATVFVEQPFDHPLLKSLVAMLAAKFPFEEYCGAGPGTYPVLEFADRMLPDWRKYVCLGKLTTPLERTGFHYIEGILWQRLTNMWLKQEKFWLHPLGPKAEQLRDQDLVKLANHFAKEPPTRQLEYDDIRRLYNTLSLQWKDFGPPMHEGYVYIARNVYMPDQVFKIGKSGSQNGRELDEYLLTKIFIPKSAYKLLDVENAVLDHFTHRFELAAPSLYSDRFKIRTVNEAINTFREALIEQGLMKERKSPSHAFSLVAR